MCYHNRQFVMNLLILTSKKGTRVIKSTHLHRALGLKDEHYSDNIKQWLSDVYQFQDGIRKPQAMSDFARAKGNPDNLLKEYYFSLEMARLVALHSRSKLKEAVANKLAREEVAYPQQVRLDTEAMLKLLELTKAMTRFSCQLAAEQRHQAAYTHRREGNGEYWHAYRKEVVGYSKEELLAELSAKGVKIAKQSSLRALLLRKDALELIRIGLIDLYAAQGHPLSYALEIGRIGRRLAEQMQLEVVDDRLGELLFAPAVDQATVASIVGAAA